MNVENVVEMELFKIVDVVLLVNLISQVENVIVMGISKIVMENVVVVLS